MSFRKFVEVYGIVKNAKSLDTDPEVTDDVNFGFMIGSKWINISTGVEWTCTDNTEGAAVWKATPLQNDPNEDAAQLALSTAEAAANTASDAYNLADSLSSDISAAVITANSAEATANTAYDLAEEAKLDSAEALNIANTASNQISGAIDQANTAFAVSAEAMILANTANENATVSLTFANTALTNANTAIIAANTAQATANTALDIGNLGYSTANTALTNANTALSAANSAQTLANTALTQAGIAQNSANIALSVANSASLKADEALVDIDILQTDLGQAVIDIENAQTLANTADTKATAAQQVANAADAKLDSLVTEPHVDLFATEAEFTAAATAAGKSYPVPAITRYDLPPQEISLMQAGVVPSNSAADASNNAGAFQTLIDWLTSKTNGGTITSGSFHPNYTNPIITLNEPIILKPKVHFDFDRSVRFRATAAMPAMVDTVVGSANRLRGQSIIGGTWDAGRLAERCFRFAEFQDINFGGDNMELRAAARAAVSLGDPARSDNNFGFYLSRAKITNTTAAYGASAVAGVEIVHGISDCNFDRLLIVGYPKGLVGPLFISRLNNIHVWSYPDTQGPCQVGFACDGGNNVFSALQVDNPYEAAFEIVGGNNYRFIGCTSTYDFGNITDPNAPGDLAVTVFKNTAQIDRLEIIGAYGNDRPETRFAGLIDIYPAATQVSGTLRYGPAHTNRNPRSVRFDPTSPPDYIGQIATSNGRSYVAVTATKWKQIATDSHSVAYAPTITPNRSLGTVRVGNLTGDITINAPSEEPSGGDQLTFSFIQSGAGGHSIAWDQVYVGGPTGGDAANTRTSVTFVYDGFRYVSISKEGELAKAAALVADAKATEAQEIQSRRDAARYYLADYLHPDDLAAVLAGNIDAQDPARVTAAVQQFHDDAIDEFALGMRGVNLYYVSGSLAMQDEVFSEYFAEKLWNLTANQVNRSNFSMHSDNTRFDTRNFTTNKAVRTSGYYLAHGITYPVPKVLWRWEQSSGNAFSPDVKGNFWVQGGGFSRRMADPIGVLICNPTKPYVKSFKVRSLSNTNFWIENITNGDFDDIDLFWGGYQPTEFGGQSGHIPHGTTFAVEADLVTVTASDATFTADHVGRWFAVSGCGEQIPNNYGRRYTHWARIDSVISPTQITWDTPAVIAASGQVASFVGMMCDVTAGSSVIEMSAEIQDDVTGRYVTVVGTYKTASEPRFSTHTSVVLSQSGRFLTLADTPMVSGTDLALVFSPMLLVAPRATTPDNHPCDNVGFHNLRCESTGWSTIASVPAVFDGATAFVCQNAKLHGCGVSNNNFGGSMSGGIFGYINGFIFDGDIEQGHTSPVFGHTMFVGSFMHGDFRGKHTHYPDTDRTAMVYLNPMQASSEVSISYGMRVGNPQFPAPNQEVVRMGPNGQAGMIRAYGSDRTVGLSLPTVLGRIEASDYAGTGIAGRTEADDTKLMRVGHGHLTGTSQPPVVADLNNVGVITNRRVRATETTLNKPDSDNYIVELMLNTTSSYYQLAWNPTGLKMAVRRNSGGSWTGWRFISLNDFGPSGSRPTPYTVGQKYFDTTLGKPIWWNGTDWVDATGTPV